MLVQDCARPRASSRNVLRGGTALKLVLAVVLAYYTQMETQAELTVQAAGYDQPTALCGWFGSCSWVARSLSTGAWEQGTMRCEMLTLECTL